jgi:hypothetical protein
MGGYTLGNVRDPIDILEVANKTYVDSTVANSGFKNKI